MDESVTLDYLMTVLEYVYCHDLVVDLHLGPLHKIGPDARKVEWMDDLQAKRSGLELYNVTVILLHAGSVWDKYQRDVAVDQSKVQLTCR